MTPEEIHRELDKLWSRVSATAPPAAQAAPVFPAEEYSLHDAPAITREVTLETIGLLKKQHRAEVTRLAQLLELKERSLAETLDRLRQTAAELDRLRRRDERSEELTTRQALAYASELEAAQNAQKAAESRLREEEERLRAAAEETRRRLNSEETRWRALEADWTAREQEYLLRLRELEARSEKERESAAAAQGVERRALADLSEAKRAVEASLSELLNERREREEAERERAKALTRVKDVEERMNELQNLWTEERKQWQELWDRERSAWEAKRQELASWEERVQRQKEAFHAKFGELEERETRHASEMTEILRRSTDAGERIGDFMRQAAAKAAELARLQPPPPAEKPRPRLDRRWLAAAAAAVILAAGAVPAWRALHRLEFTLEQSHLLDSARPTSIGFDGGVLWVSEWEGGLLALDPADPAVVKRRTVVGVKPPYHPAALSVWAGKMYTLDAAQARILRHPIEEPERVEASWPTPGPAPAALAHDGRNLWSYDASNGVLYRHLGEGSGAGTEAYRIAGDVVPTAMRWHKDELWVWDGKAKRVTALELQGKEFSPRQSAELPSGDGKSTLGAMAFLFTYKAEEGGKQRLQLWALTLGADGQPAIKKFNVRR